MDRWHAHALICTECDSSYDLNLKNTEMMVSIKCAICTDTDLLYVLPPTFMVD